MDFLTQHWQQIVVAATLIGSAFALRERLTALTTSVGEHRAESKERASKLDGKLEAIATTVSTHTARLDVVDAEHTHLKDEHTHLKDELVRAHTRLDAHVDAQKEIISTVTKAVWDAASDAGKNRR